MSKVSRVLSKQFKKMQSPDGALVLPEFIDSIKYIDDTMTKWVGTLRAPGDCPYEGFIFHFGIEYPHDYPHAPPSITFVTPIYHANVDSQFRPGMVRHPTLMANWSPKQDLVAQLNMLVALLRAPEPGPGGKCLAQPERVDQLSELARWADEYAAHPGSDADDEGVITWKAVLKREAEIAQVATHAHTPLPRELCVTNHYWLTSP